MIGRIPIDRVPFERSVALIVFASNIIFILTVLFVAPSFSSFLSFAEPASDAETTIGISPSETALIDLYPGEFKASSEQNVTVTTNNYTGYTLFFSTDSATTDLVNLENETLTIPTISLNDGETSRTANNFGYGYGYSVDGINYKPIPGFIMEEGNPIASSEAIDSTNTAGSKITNLNFAAKIPEDTAPGSYYNNFKLSATANEITYSLDFSGNADEDVANIPEGTIVGTFNGTGVLFELSDKIPSRFPYSFLGWSEDQNLTDSSVLYQPGETFALDPTKGGTHTLYAHWEFRCHPNATTISHDSDVTDQNVAICMQDMNINVAKSMVEEEQYTLYDSRDLKPYFISMLKDGNVWMTQNLDLGDAEKSYTLTSADTDLAEGQTFILPAFTDINTVPFDTEIYNSEQRQVTNFATVKDGGDKYYVPQINSTNDNTVYESLEACTMANSEDTCRHYHVGNYYNLYSITAGTVTNSNPNFVESASTSLCPSGWTLTTAINESKSFRNLIHNAYGGTYGSRSSGVASPIMIGQPPLYLNRVGYYYTSVSKKEDVVDGDAYTFNTRFSGDSLLPANGFTVNPLAAHYSSSNSTYRTTMGLINELPIRCIARDNVTPELIVNYNYQDGTTPTKTETIIYDSENPNSSRLMIEKPNREGYDFIGWALQPNASEPTYIAGDVLHYSTKDIPTTTHIIDLYAIWQTSGVNLLSTITTMQEMTPEICNGTTTPTSKYFAPSAKLTDVRDGKTYWVAKLADGNCWMTQNLNLGDEDISYVLTSYDSDVGNSFVLPAEKNTIKDDVFDAPTYRSVNHSIIENQFLESSVCQETYGSEKCERFSVGTIYNYFSASAGTGGSNKNSGDVPDSICPLGWMLPNGTGTSSYQGLVDKYSLSTSSPTNYKEPINLVMSGYGSFGSTSSLIQNGIDLNGGYWTRNVFNSYGAREFAIEKDSFTNAQNYYSPKMRGDLVRCVARPNASYTLTFNNNGGTGSPANITAPATNTGHNTFSIPETIPTRTDFTFAGWNTKADGTGTSINPGDEYSVSGSATIYATWNFTLKYDANGGENAPESLTQAGGSTAKIEVSSVIPVKDNKKFIGWSTSLEDDSVLYSGGSLITANTPETTLYAIWDDTERGLATISNMQEMSGSICADTPIHYSKQLFDTRDGKKYWVSKLADGNCWMTQNLDLGSKDTSYTLTPEDSDVLEDFTLPVEDSSMHFASDSNDSISFRASNGEYSVRKNIEVFGSSSVVKSLAACMEITDLDEEACRHYHTGAYYNWYTATAGTGTSESIQYEIADSSICPAGWRLPLGRSSASSLVSEYSKLLFSEGAISSASNSTNTVNITNNYSVEFDPLYFSRAGYYSSTTTNDVISDTRYNINYTSFYWDSTARSSVAADLLYVYAFGYVVPQYSLNKNIGSSIRCIARSNETYTLSYNANGGEEESVPISQTSAVTDKGRYTFTLSSTIPTRDGYTFAGWNTEADGSGNMYQPGEEFLTRASTTLYAAWQFTLSYDANGGEGVPEEQIVAGGVTANPSIPETEPTRDGFYFWGWSLSSSGETETYYYPKDKITLDTADTTLYAVWRESDVPLETITYMQEINSNICRETPINYSKQLIDQRDGKDYWVTKLADGNCWMTQNLDLGDNEHDYLLTPENSDVKKDFILTKKDYSKIYDSEWDAVNFNEADVFYATKPSGMGNSYATKEACSEEMDMDAELCKHYHSGNQYNYYTATAGSATDDYGNFEASSSLCPAGWRMPTLYEHTLPNIKSYNNLISVAYNISNSAAGSIQIKQNPLYYVPVYSSKYLGNNVGSYGGYWTSTAYSTTHGRDMWFTINEVLVSDYMDKRTYYFNIRCVARNTPVDYAITYNYQDGITEPETKHLSFDGETRSLMIDTEKPERDGYNFVGWGTEPDSTEPSYMPGDFFNEYYTNSNMPTEDLSLELYAIWEESVNLLSTITTMQEMTPEICNGTTTPTTDFGAPSAQLTDTRDGKKYWVSKLADGKCWMTENLDLGSKEIAYTLTPENSDVDKDFELPVQPTTSFNSSNYNVINFRNNDFYAVTSRNTWGDYIYRTEDECNAVYGENNSFCQHYHIGGYYNWYTVTAGAGLSTTSADFSRASTSICPAGWRLPYGKTNSSTPSEFSTLLYNYNIISSAATGTGNLGFVAGGLNSIRSNPLYFTRSGYYNGTSISNLQSQGYYNSAHANSAQYIYSLYFFNNNVQANSRNSKFYGYNARCVARDTETYTLYYDENGGTTTIEPQSVDSNLGHAAITLSDTIPVRAGYRFIGYSRDKFADTADYLPGETYTWTDRSLRLYAIWEIDFSCHPNANSIGNIESTDDIVDETKAICMQDMNTSVAQSMNEEQQYQLIDIRDNTIYFVSRLKDGNVWMTQNLDLGNKNQIYTLTPADSDVKEEFILPTTPSTAFNAANVNTTNFRDPGNVFYVDSNVATSDDVANSIEACDELSDELNRSTCYHYHAGNYYNWYTATAGTGSNAITGGYEQAESSICPAGWRLPMGVTTGTISSDFPALFFAHGVISSDNPGQGNIGYKSGGLNAVRSAPLYFTRSGYYNNAAVANTRSDGFYWSSGNSSAANALAVQFYTANLRTNYPLAKYQGRSVRCMARNTATNFTMNYHRNDGSDTIDTEIIPYTGVGLELMVKTEIPEREGYVFKGWSTEPDATEPNYLQGQLFERKTNSTMSTSPDSLDLYAIWEESINLLTTISTMQEMTPAICEGTTTPGSNYGAPTAKLTDTRDGKVYWVSKLADGKCWMTQNLDLGDKENTYTLTPEDSDVTQNFELTPEDSTIQFTNLTYDVTNFRDRGDEYIVPNNNTSANTDWIFYSKERCEKLYDSGYCAHYHVGNYYNWHTATAGTGVYNNGTNYNTLSSSICPAGWRLPSAEYLTTDGSDFANLLSHEITTTVVKTTGAGVYQPNGFNTLRNNALYIPRAGYINNNAFASRTAQGLYWTSTVASLTNAYSLYFIQTAPNPNYSVVKYIGRNVRCVARSEETYTLTYDANGGENAPETQSAAATNVGHTTFTLSSIIPTREGFTFAGWNTASDGSGVLYQPGDTYTAGGSTTLYALWQYTLTYNANGGNDAPAPITAAGGASHKFIIDTTVPTKENNTFLGWSEDSTAASGTFYGNSFFEVTNPTTTIYAIWGESVALDTISTMQEMTSTICSNTPIGYSKQLEDIRDRTIDEETNNPIAGTGSKYYVSKLADGKCWMTQNLDFAPIEGHSYYGDDGDESHIPDTDIGYGTSDAANVWTPDTVSTTASLSTGNANKYIYRDVGNRFYVNSNTIANDITYTTREACEAAQDSVTCAHDHAGNYYNWRTAVAGSGVYGSGSGANYTSAKNSICPYGWRLPYGRNSASEISEMANLILQYNVLNDVPLNNNALPLNLDGLNKLRSYPLYFPRAGFFYNARSIDNAGNRVIYWTSTNNANANAYAFYSADSASLTPNAALAKNQAFNIRCVAR